MTDMPWPCPPVTSAATSERQLRTWPAIGIALWLLITCCAALPGCSRRNAHAKDDSPAGIVAQFYDLRIRSPTIGLPDARQLEVMRPFLSSELQTLLQTPRTAGPAAKQAGGQPKQQRAFIDGDLFSSIAQGPTSFRTGVVEALDHDAHIIPVRFVSGRQLPAINWTDRVKVINENGRYVVADVEYANHWLAGSGSLLSSLKRSQRS